MAAVGFKSGPNVGRFCVSVHSFQIEIAFERNMDGIIHGNPANLIGSFAFRTNRLHPSPLILVLGCLDPNLIGESLRDFYAFCSNNDLSLENDVGLLKPTMVTFPC